jgi:limonene-1,2-epoxide hydrolase
MRHFISVVFFGSLLIVACHQASKTEESILKSQMEQETIHVIKKLHKAMNDHNLDAMLDCVDTGYISEQPFYPDRNFAGREQMQKNWSGTFENTPDFASSLKRYAVSNDTIWAEWLWTGTQEDGSQSSTVVVTIFKVKGGRITNGRLFVK